MNNLEEPPVSELSPTDHDLCRRILELSRTRQLPPTARSRILALLDTTSLSTDPTPCPCICLTA